MWAFSDLVAFNYDKGIQNFLSSWNSQFLGFHNEVQSNTLPIVLGLITRNNIIAQKIYFLSFLPLSFITMYFFVRKHFKSFYSKFFSSFLYAVNPITIGEFVNGSVWMINYALLPLVLYLLLKIYETSQLKNIVLYGLLVAIIIGLFLGPLWIVILNLLPILFIIFFYKFLDIQKTQLKLFLEKSFFISFFVLIGLVLLLPTIYHTISIKTQALREQSIASYFKDVEYCYSKATLPNLLRLAGNAGSPMNMLDYNELNWWTILGMIIPFIAFFPLISKKNSKQIFDITLYFLILLTVLF
jgi:hypothetical protein